MSGKAGELSPALTPYIDTWLRDHRRRLLAQGNGEKTDRFWIDRWAKQWARTPSGLSFVDHDPNMVALVPDLLGHAAHHTAHKHYILADSALAHKAVQTAIEARRAVALARFRERKGDGHAD